MYIKCVAWLLPRIKAPKTVLNVVSHGHSPSYSKLRPLLTPRTKLSNGVRTHFRNISPLKTMVVTVLIMITVVWEESGSTMTEVFLANKPCLMWAPCYCPYRGLTARPPPDTI